MTRIFAALVFLFANAACGDRSPTSPTASGVLTIDRASIFVGRHETGQLNASFTPTGATSQNVTSAATWTSSNPAIVTVNAGLVTAVGIGVASVIASYQGQRREVSVTARRRTAITGAIRVREANRRKSMCRMTVWLDDRYLTGAGDCFDGPLLASIEAQVDTTVDPGSHKIAVRVEDADPPDTYVSDASSQIVIVDADTKERLRVIPLPVQQNDTRTTIAWDVLVAVYFS